MGLVSAMGFVDEEGNFARAKQAFAADALATMFGSIFSLSPVTSYIESGAGVEAGARTGLTACFCGFFFFLSIFFAPISKFRSHQKSVFITIQHTFNPSRALSFLCIVASIPPWATGGALVIVGALMAKSLRKVKWHDPAHAATAFVTVMIMPLTYSIAYGLLAGITWLFLQIVFFVLERGLGVKRPEFEPESETRIDQTVHPHPSRAITREDAEAEEEVQDDSDSVLKIQDTDEDVDKVTGSRPEKMDPTEYLEHASESEYVEA